MSESPLWIAATGQERNLADGGYEVGAYTSERWT